MSTDLPPPFGLTQHLDGTVTVALPLSSPTTGVDLCLFDADGSERRLPFTDRLGSTWWISLAAATVPPETRYAIRATGEGHNPAKMLIDPWAKAFDGHVDWLTKPGVHRMADSTDSAPFVPRSIVVDDSFDWAGDVRPNTAWTDTVIYEVHVKGATMTHPGVPGELRGTYAGFCHPAFIAHLVGLGVTAVELLPIHHHVPEERLAGLGLTNYWGYNTLGFLAPHAAYAHAPAGSDAVRECKGMVKLLHEAGIEVILDVVYNHSCEGGTDGVALSLRGLDPHGWYRPFDTTGCGNSLDLNQPTMLSLVMDSLRYWVQEFHVDGFRFDLATTLARGRGGDFEANGVFLNAVAQDPVLATVKLIAEAWDVGDGGYQVGAFPAPWAEWNDRYRDLMRDHWNNAPRPLGAVARRITGNPDLFASSGRRPWASVNMITAHDGFCLRDLVSYNDKHNEANGENNHDGSNDNRSWNHGVEGETDEPKIRSARERTQRNLLATLFISQGTPMLVGGDELGRTQGGNNNAYCLDNPVSWIDWDNVDSGLFNFVRALITVRRTSAVLRQKEWIGDSGAQWFAPDGTEMTIARWDDPDGCGLQLLLHGKEAADDRLVVLHEWITSECFTLPAGTWTLLLSTALPDDAPVFVIDGIWEPQFPTLAIFARR